MAKADIFVADAHLKGKDDPATERFIQFLDCIKDSTRTLYILGDLFDLWYNRNNAFFPLLRKKYQPVLDKLEEVSKASVKIVYFEGNHDFFMGDFFAKTLNASVFNNGADINIDGKRFHITHGDMINPYDKGYLWLRKAFRSRIAYVIMRMLPSAVLLSITDKMSKTSRKTSCVSKKIVSEEIISSFAQGKHSANAYAVVFAHTHKSMLKEENGRFTINPGAFSNEGSYIQYQNDSFSLKRFN